MQGEDTDRRTFIDRVLREVKSINYPMLVDGYQLFKLVHAEQERKDGSRYVTHPRAVAEILMDFGPATFEEVLTALLHDVLEDGYLLPDMLKTLFGAHVAWGAIFLSKWEVTLGEHGDINKKKHPTDFYYRRIARAEHGIRRVKCADRIHNLRTMGPMGMKHQREQVEETRTYILPIARVTDESMAAELERLCQEYESSWTEAL